MSLSDDVHKVFMGGSKKKVRVVKTDDLREKVEELKEEISMLPETKSRVFASDIRIFGLIDKVFGPELTSFARETKS